MPNVSTPCERPLVPPAVAAAAVESPRPRTRVWTAALACLIALALGFNAWWYWRDVRSIADLDTVSDWIRRGHLDRAEDALREHLRRAPHDGAIRMLFARALATRGDLLGCARQLHEVPVWSTQRAEASLREGQSYLKLDRARDAEAAWLTALTNDVAHRIAPDLFYDIAQELLKLYAVEDRWDDAYPVIWMAYDHASPSEHEILLAMRLRPELERVSPNESREALRRYVAAAADDWEAIRALARAERALGNTDEAKRLFQMCLTGNPEDVRAWHNQLDLVLDQGDQAGFLTLLAKAPRSAEDEPETWMLRGVARERAGDLPTAAAYFRKSIGLNPFVPRYHYRLATVEQRLGLHAQAARHRERSKQMNEARAQLPSAYADFFAAREHLDGAAEMATACKHLASICATLGWFRAAQGWSCLVDTP